MNRLPRILTGLGEIAGGYDALVCDVWGVLHDGQLPHMGAVEALRRFRHTRGPVVLLSNAARPDIEGQLRDIGVPADCFDAIVTSGAATRDDLERRSAHRRLRMFFIGAERNIGIFAGLPVDCVGEEEAEIVLCAALWDDETETPQDYLPLLHRLKARGLQMLCANPDRVAPRGGRLVYCAGAIAGEYEKLGGSVIYYGKPKSEIYDNVRAHLGGASRPLAVGDGLHTDIKGANGVGLDALFVADGVHGEDVAELTAEHMEKLFAEARVHAVAAIRKLVW